MQMRGANIREERNRGSGAGERASGQMRFPGGTFASPVGLGAK